MSFSSFSSLGHLDNLQKAFQAKLESDKTISFYCRDGKVSTKCFPYQVHSKLMNTILIDLKNESDFHVIIPDLRVCDIQHLHNILTNGSSSFNTNKLSNTDRISDVISDFLTSAEVLDIHINDYKFHLAGDTVEDDIAAEEEHPPEYFEELTTATVKEEASIVDSKYVDYDNQEESVIDISDDEDGEVFDNNAGATASVKTEGISETTHGDSVPLKEVSPAVAEFYSKDEASDKESLKQRRSLEKAQKEADKAKMYQIHIKLRKKMLKVERRNETSPVKQPNQCNLCPKSYPRESYLFFHIWYNHFLDLQPSLRKANKLAQKCEFCTSSVNKYDADAHVLFLHKVEGGPRKCIWCPKMFKDLNILKRTCELCSIHKITKLIISPQLRYIFTL